MKRQRQRKVSVNTWVMDLEGGWSRQALGCFDMIPGESIGRFYLWHITRGGRISPGQIPGLGKVTFNEIRTRLVRNGFPGFDLKVFGLGYFSTPSTKSALYKLLEQWKTATPSEKIRLQKNLALHQSSGGH